MASYRTETGSLATWALDSAIPNRGGAKPNTVRAPRSRGVRTGFQCGSSCTANPLRRRVLCCRPRSRNIDLARSTGFPRERSSTANTSTLVRVHERPVRSRLRRAVLAAILPALVAAAPALADDTRAGDSIKPVPEQVETSSDKGILDQTPSGEPVTTMPEEAETDSENGALDQASAGEPVTTSPQQVETDPDKGILDPTPKRRARHDDTGRDRDRLRGWRARPDIRRRVRRAEPPTGRDGPRQGHPRPNAKRRARRADTGRDRDRLRGWHARPDIRRRVRHAEPATGRDGPRQGHPRPNAKRRARRAEPPTERDPPWKGYA